MNLLRTVSESSRNLVKPLDPRPTLEIELHTAADIFEDAKFNLKQKAPRRPSLVSTISIVSIESFGSANMSIVSQGHNHTKDALQGIQRLEELQKKVELNKKIREAEVELIRTYEYGKTKRRRYKKEIRAYERNKASVGRSLWLKQKNQKVNPLAGMVYYKTAMLRCSLPCHDRSQSTITQEAKLLRAGHSMKILANQLKVIQATEQKLVDFMLKDCLPEARKDHISSKEQIETKVKEAIKSRDKLVEVYEKHLGIQRKIIGKTKLREIEDDNVAVESTDMDLIKMIAGETKIFEPTKLRLSAEKRISARYGSLEKRQAKKKARDEIFNNTLENAEALEKHSMMRAENIVGKVEQLLASLHATAYPLNDDLKSNNGESFEKNSNEIEFSSNGKIVDKLKVIHSGKGGRNSCRTVLKMEGIATDADSDSSLSALWGDSSNPEPHYSHPTIVEDETLRFSEHTKKKESSKSLSTTISEKKRAAFSARLEVLRIKRQESTMRANSHRTTSSGESSGFPRQQLLERARSARLHSNEDVSARGSGALTDRKARMEQLKAGSRGSLGAINLENGARRLSESRLAEMREKRRSRAATASG
jgi:hypothetical protein